jgi:hypothetical protein
MPAARGPARPRAIGCEAAGVCAIVSQEREENNHPLVERRNMVTSLRGFEAKSTRRNRQAGSSGRGYCRPVEKTRRFFAVGRAFGLHHQTVQRRPN